MAGFIGKVLQYTPVVKGGVTVAALKVALHEGENIVAEMYAPSGDDSPPLVDDLVFLAKNSATGGYSYVGTIDQGNTPQAEQGEKRLYARDANGAEITYIWLKGDGVAEINGAADFAVRFNELQTKLSALESQLLAHVHPGVSSGSSSTAPSTTVFDIDISGAKVAEVKLP